MDTQVDNIESGTSSDRRPEFRDPQLYLWLLRILMPLGGYKKFVAKNEFQDDDVARMVGFADLLDTREAAPKFERDDIVRRLRLAWEEAERNAPALQSMSDDDVAVRRLGGMLGFSETEVDIIRIRLAVERHRELRLMLNQLGTMNHQTLCETLSTCLGRPDADIKTSLAFDSTLLTSGIIGLHLNHGFVFGDVLSMLECIAEEIHCEHDDPATFFRSRIVKSPPPRLTVKHFPHAARDCESLSHYLRESISEQRKGVNVLIYGDPGCGKTEFVRMISAALGTDLYEVACATRDGTVLDADRRFRAYRLSQALFERFPGKLILFDEIEDVFHESDKGKRTNGNASSRKAWVNKMLENNPVPAFWISNNIYVIDRAYLRRFDYVLEMKVPPRSVRSQILDEYLLDLPVSDSWKRRMAEHEDLMPAVVERAAKVVRSAKMLPQVETERSLARVIGNTLEVMGLSRDPRHANLTVGYRLDVLNTDCDMVELQDSLAAHRQGRICLYGPPGTGKTAFGQHVAAVLDRPLLVRRGSDIISPWLGMTERNLARMFRQALDEEAVLLLDEADSFLQDRQGAQRSWEITEVNEMLTQMESFEGIFIASTNAMSSLDSAALRRFDLKIRFDYLKPEQAWALFIDTRIQLGIEDGMNLDSSVARLDCLTPGDFANVIRQARLRPVRSSMILLQRLRAESDMKPEGRKHTIGFAA